MSREWKPGDVALVKFAWQTSCEPLVCIRAEQAGALGWLHPGKLGGFTSDRAPAGPTSVRPLVALDLGDYPARDAVEILRDRPLGIHTLIADQIEAQTKPPKPDEPRGLGAVVEDTEGREWLLRIRHETRTTKRPWIHYDAVTFTSTSAAYDEIDAVRVLSEGAPS